MPPKDSKKKGAKARGPKTADDGGAEARARVEEVEAAPAAAAAAVVAAGGGDIDADVEGPLAADDLVPGALPFLPSLLCTRAPPSVFMCITFGVGAVRCQPRVFAPKKTSLRVCSVLRSTFA
jgi:hypothetical protein